MIPPYIGDIRLLRDYPPGTPLSEITEFEVWDGEKWWKSTDPEPVFELQLPEPGDD